VKRGTQSCRSAAGTVLALAQSIVHSFVRVLGPMGEMGGHRPRVGAYVMADGDGHLDAWTARGTRMGLEEGGNRVSDRRGCVGSSHRSSHHFVRSSAKARGFASDYKGEGRRAGLDIHTDISYLPIPSLLTRPSSLLTRLSSLLTSYSPVFQLLVEGQALIFTRRHSRQPQPILTSPARKPHLSTPHSSSDAIHTDLHPRSRHLSINATLSLDA
jgi:hypothetical protein